MHGAPAAPAAITVQLRDGTESDATPRRVFRVTRGIAENHLILERPAPFDPDQPVDVFFALPGDSASMAVSGRMRVLGEIDEEEGHRGTKMVVFEQIESAHRERVAEYVRDRLQLQPPV